MAKRDKRSKQDIATKNYLAGRQLVRFNPALGALSARARFVRVKKGKYPADGLAYVSIDGVITCNPNVRAEPKQWARAIAHCLLHLGMGHFQERSRPDDWNIACDYAVESFLSIMKFGEPFNPVKLPLNNSDAERVYHSLGAVSDKTDYLALSTAGYAARDMKFKPSLSSSRNRAVWPPLSSSPPNWEATFAAGLSRAVRNAVKASAGELGETSSQSAAHFSGAMEWFISNYPLLGAIAARFTIIEDPLVCHRMGIQVAAISPSMGEIYINPHRDLSVEEKRFVIAHELLHAALQHDSRREWRDAFFWNLACDFVINLWLTEMGVGERPDDALYDEQLKGMSAEAVYDLIMTNTKKYKRYATLRGRGLGDILPGSSHGNNSDVDLDDFYRRAIAQGLTYHQEQRRGYLPAGLIEEIRALSHPPIPWDVELANWFDEHFTPDEKARSYARLSRRQSSTPDIPRPSWTFSQNALSGRTFGVVLDTSGSMERSLLAKSLGAIASYSVARDVPAARVVFCDASPHDMGYMQPEEIAGSVKVKGRGGTVLQPGVDLLLQAEDFPKTAPILVITDTYCDKPVFYGREHAYLIPRGSSLPFVAKGKVFRMK